MKKKLGFTLIELLAIIVILAIIAVITVPIILNVIENSKRGAAIASAYGYKEAVEKYNLSNTENVAVLDGEYSIKNNGKLSKEEKQYSIMISGTIPSGGYLTLNKGHVNKGCIQIKEYAVTLKDGKVTNAKKDICSDTEPEIAIEMFTQVEDPNPGVICGTGQEEDYDNNEICYIYSVEDLVAFSYMVNNGKTFENKKVMLMNNLDITNDKSYINPNVKNFGDINKDNTVESIKTELNKKETEGYPTIGNDTNQFKGTFEGNAHRINNLYINQNKDYVGLFGYNSGIIEGVILEKAYINGNQYIGGIAGYNNNTIQSVRFDGTIFGNRNIGGIAGEIKGNDSSITDAIVDANIDGNNGQNIGGIVGCSSNSATIKAVYRSGSISGYTNYVNKAIGSTAATVTRNTFSLDTILVNNEATTSDDIESRTGYTVSQENINSIPLYEQFMDTYMGGDNNGDDYYFDYNEQGKVELYSIEERPLIFNLQGEGIDENPYKITSYNELKQVAYNLGDDSADTYYRLENNLDLSNQKMIMLSSETNPFKGYFDGQRHSIDNMNIFGFNQVGLFGNNMGTISNIRINNPNISGYDNVGSIIGYNTGIFTGGWVLDSTILGNDTIGGITGYNSNTIQSVRFDGTIFGNRNIGGIAGEIEGNDSSITDAIADANIDGNNGQNIGGIVGYSSNSATIKAVYRSGSISGYTNYVNKAIGANTSTVTKNTFSLDTILINNKATTSDDIESRTGYTVSQENINSIPLYEQFMDTYMGGDNNGDGYYFDYNEQGKVELYSIDERPLIFNLQGEGTDENPYKITSYNELKQVAYNLGEDSADTYYRLENNLDLSNQKMIMLSSETNPFKGYFDGQRHSIDNMSIFGYNQVGLFGNNEGTIKNLRINNPNIGGYDNVGSIIGYNTGIFTGGWVLHSTILGNDTIGGITGYNSNTIQSVRFDGTIFGNRNIGGIAGEIKGNDSSITDAIVDANIDGNNGQNIGGIVGYSSYSAAIKAVYRSGSISGYTNYVNKAIGATSSTVTRNTFSLDTILINNKATTSDDIESRTGYTVSQENINSIPLYEQFMDTYMGGDNNGDGYYFDYNEQGKVELYSIEERPLIFNLQGEGTDENPYKITSYNELKQFAYKLGKESFGKYYQLNNDIDMLGQNMIMLSSETNQFRGIFRGQRHSINNLRIFGYNYVGLFGNSIGLITDLRLNNINISGYDNVGGVIGYNEGGFVGGWILNANITGHELVGGIVGDSYKEGYPDKIAMIADLRFQGTINGGGKLGGIAGRANGTSITCVLVDAEITGSSKEIGKNIGGIVGYVTNSTVTGVYRSGSVSGYTNLVNKVIGSKASTADTGIHSLDTILVNGTATTSDDIESRTGLTINSTEMKNKDHYRYTPTVNGYYYDNNAAGDIELYHVDERPYPY